MQEMQVWSLSQKMPWGRAWQPTLAFLPREPMDRGAWQVAVHRVGHDWRLTSSRSSIHNGIFSSVAHSCPTLCNPVDCSTPGFPVLHQLPELAQTHVHWVSEANQLSHPLMSPSPPALNLSQHQGLFQWVSSLHQVAKALEFQLQHQSFQWVFRTDLLAVQGTLKSLLQHYSSKASILWRSAFSMVQLSHPYMATGKTIALTRQTFVGKVMSLLFNVSAF